MPTLHDILTDANLLAGWMKVRENQGGPGIDGQTIADFEKRLYRHIDTLRSEVLQGAYRPKPLLRVMIPKKGGGERGLAIPSVRDRVLQAATAIVLTPLFEAEFEDISFAYRRGRSVDQAAARVEALRDQGYRWVVDADIHAFFDEVDHKLLMKSVSRLVDDEDILALIRQWLRAEVRDGKRGYRMKKGVPQGSPISPMLANLYLDRLDDVMLDHNRKLIRYADDFLVLCKSRESAEDALELTEDVLAALRLELNENKTRIVDFNQGFRFLGVQFIRSLAFKLEHAHEPALTASPAATRHAKKSRRQTEPAVVAPPPTTLAAAFAEAGIEADDFPARPAEEAERQLAPPPETDDLQPGHRLDPRLRTLYLLKHGQVLGKESERLVIRYRRKIIQQIPAIKVDQIMVFGNAQITTQAMHFCLAERIPIYLLSAAGKYYGAIESFDTDPVLLHKAQFATADDPGFALAMARGFIRGKVANCRTLLKRMARTRNKRPLEKAALSLKHTLKQIRFAEDLDQLRGYEGNAARIYFDAVRQILDPEWGFVARKKQPPPDPVNALLSYGYTLLFYNLYSLLRARGLNPHIGYLHPLRMGHPALASDMIEEFRALVVDTIVWNLLLNNRLDPDDFRLPDAPGQACWMGNAARARFIHELEKKLNAPIIHPASGHKLDYRRCMEYQINSLASAIRDNRPEYTPMTPR